MPELSFGNYTYEEKPCPSKDVYDILGDEGVEFIDKKIKELIKYRIEMFGKRVKKTHGFYMEQKFIDFKTKSILTLPVIGREYLSGDYIYDKKDANNESLFIEGNYFIGIDKEATEEIKDFTIEKIAWYYGLTHEIKGTHNFRYLEERLYPDGDRYPDF